MLNSVQDPLDFEDLTAIYRVEKKAPSLSVVRKDLYPAIARLLMGLSAEYNKQLSMDPDSLICEGANQRRKKAKQLSKEVVELRMQKICSLALRGAMGAQNVIDQLTPEEKEYYNNVLDISRKHGALITKMTGEKKYDSPRIDPDVPSKKDPVVETPSKPIQKETAVEPAVEVNFEPELEMEEPQLDNFPEDAVNYDDNATIEEDRIFATPVPQIVDDDLRPSGKKEKEISSHDNPFTTNDMVLIRITENLPEFSGPDRDYRLSKEDVIMMPRVMADALIHREKAILLTPSP